MVWRIKKKKKIELNEIKWDKWNSFPKPGVNHFRRPHLSSSLGIAKMRLNNDHTTTTNKLRNSGAKR